MQAAPPVNKTEGKDAAESARRKDEVQLLEEICGVFRPGVLTALMGASGAGKTTLMDVLSGRKTSAARPTITAACCASLPVITLRIFAEILRHFIP